MQSDNMEDDDNLDLVDEWDEITSNDNSPSSNSSFNSSNTMNNNNSNHNTDPRIETLLSALWEQAFSKIDNDTEDSKNDNQVQDDQPNPNNFLMNNDHKDFEAALMESISNNNQIDPKNIMNNYNYQYPSNNANNNSPIINNILLLNNMSNSNNISTNNDILMSSNNNLNNIISNNNIISQNNNINTNTTIFDHNQDFLNNYNNDKENKMIKKIKSEYPNENNTNEINNKNILISPNNNISNNINLNNNIPQMKIKSEFPPSLLPNNFFPSFQNLKDIKIDYSDLLNSNIKEEMMNLHSKEESIIHQNESIKKENGMKIKKEPTVDNQKSKKSSSKPSSYKKRSSKREAKQKTQQHVDDLKQENFRLEKEFLILLSTNKILKMQLREMWNLLQSNQKLYEEANKDPSLIPFEKFQKKENVMC